MKKKLAIGVTSGIGGHFAILYEVDSDGLMEPWQTGLAHYRTRREALGEAVSWSKSDGIQLESGLLEEWEQGK